jgi:hypothetical protein
VLPLDLLVPLSAANFLLAAHDQGILCVTLGHSPFFPRRLPA